MKKQVTKFRIILVALILVFVLSYNSKLIKTQDYEYEPPSIPQLIPPTFNVLGIIDTSSAIDAWAVFQDYRNFAKNHDLVGMRNLSHQISATCNDPAKEKECFSLMDSVYSISSTFEFNQFKHIIQDKRQIIMYTDRPTVAILYFTRSESERPKLLAISICFEDDSSIGSCINPENVKRDQNGNGWWDSVESFFYSIKI